MSIIIQTGHSSSYSDKLMKMLYERGLGIPIRSHTHGLSANDITKKLSKILSKGEAIINTKIIDNLIVDLLLANLDQDDWGWSDEQNLDVLSYWQQADNSVRFVLVFDSPKLLLGRLVGQEITSELLETAVCDWIDYHKKLLAFFDSQSSHCLLIEGDLAIDNLTNVKEYIQTIDANLKTKKHWQLQANPTDKSEEIINPVFEMVVDEILKQYPECLALYKALIEKSTIRFKNKNLPTINKLDVLAGSLNLLTQQEKLNKKILTENEALQQQLLAFMSEKKELEQQLLQNSLLLEQSKNSINAEQQVQIERADQENKLLVSQLHQVQEELERYYLQHQTTTEQLKLVEQQKQQLQAQAEARKKLESELVNLKEVKQKSDNLAKEKQRLESELVALKEAKKKADEQAKSSNHAKQENELLISQLHQVQEELERYYLENQKLKSEQKKEPSKPVYYGAADRVKEDLPYRLGATMVSHSKSAKDLAVLPLALAKEYREFNKNKPNDELPAIEEYQDAYEAEKVKKHLSYRLGKTLVDGLKSPKSAIDLPVKLGREIVGFNKK